MAQLHDNQYDPWILLLETPFLSQTGTEEVRAYVKSKYNLALLSLGSYIRAHSDLKVGMINMVKDRIAAQDLLDRLKGNPPAVIGVSLYTYNLNITYRMITLLKKEFPNSHICVGGPHVSIFPIETLGLENIDSIVVGDGEFPFLKICRQVIKTGSLSRASLPPGTYIKDSLNTKTPLIPYMEKDLDSLPAPDLNLLGDFRRYRDFLSNKIMGLLTSSRGCPNLCHYCLSEKSRYRRFSIEHTIDVMQKYSNMGVEYIEFWDETFNTSKKRVADFADALLNADLKISWGIRGAVVNNIDSETIAKLKRTGLKLIRFGVETTVPRLLSYLHKDIELDQIKAAFDTCRSIGLRTVANLMINIPGQTRGELLLDLENLKKIRPTYVSISVYNWAPGTTHYMNALHDGTFENDFWRAYAKTPFGPEPLTHAETEIPINEVYRIRDRFVSRHYFNLRYICDYIRSIDLSEISQAVQIAVLMLKSRLRSAVLLN